MNKIFNRLKKFLLGRSWAKWMLIYLLVLSLLAAFAPLFFSDPNAQDVSMSLSRPSGAHYFGTDQLGRDLLARCVYGARISLLIGVGSALTALIFGAILGAISAYFGGWVDQALMRFVDVWYSFPSLLLIVLLKEIVERGDPQRGFWSIVLALSIYSWMHVARIVRGEILKLRELSFIEAQRALGAGHLRIIFRHLLPNTLNALLVALTMRIPLAIIAESMLGFIGLGVKSPLASWGTLASEGWSGLRFYPHLIFFPSMILFLTVLAFNILGEALRETLDPRQVRL